MRLEDPHSHDILPAPDRYNFEGLSTMRGNTNKSARAIPEKASKILEVPGVIDDYYLNLISWSEDNILAVGLGSEVYLYNNLTEDVH
eukprot:scaffold18740_cov122-Cylindrotheca_fusiformis.AAC.1